MITCLLNELVAVIKFLTKGFVFNLSGFFHGLFFFFISEEIHF